MAKRCGPSGTGNYVCKSSVAQGFPEGKGGMTEGGGCGEVSGEKTRPGIVARRAMVRGE